MNKTNEKYFFWVMVLLVLLVLPTASYVLGGYNTCRSGGGYVSGLSCVEMRVMDVCEFDGSFYVRDVVENANISKLYDNDAWVIS